MSEEIVIGDVRPRIQAIGDGQQSEFIYPFAIFKESDLEVYLGETLQSGTYSVQGAGQSVGGNVVFSHPPENGVIVTLRRRLDIHRTSDFAEGGAFHARVINRELDYLVAVAQQNADDINNRAVMLNPTDADATLVLPTKEARRRRSLAFDDAGSPVPGPTVSDILQAQQSAEATVLAAQQAKESQIAAETAAASVDYSELRRKTEKIQTIDVEDHAITQEKIDPSVQLSGPSLGTNSIIRTNSSTIVENITIPVGTNGMSAGPIRVAKTNEFLWSEDLTQGVWTDPLNQWSVVNVNGLNPFGVTQQVSEVSLTEPALIRYGPTDFIVGQTYTFSAYFKLTSGHVTHIEGDQGDGDVVNIGTPTAAWQRFSFTFVANANLNFDLVAYCYQPSTLQIFGAQTVEGTEIVPYEKTTMAPAEATVTVDGTWTVVGG
ncbi:phage head spike fiber domain-containing protein [Terasakiella pusilla]|uniref:phage head spike fiber domain-containing protein n=1 Tax=Terasakiella pusilla TaxID=64973 RepID=UPI003AA87A33